MAKLTLGPVLFNWPAEKKRDFYFRIADEAPVDIVYIGEAVCAKRRPFFDPYLPEVVDRLLRAGKEVVHSTLALVVAPAELEALRRDTADTELLIEANDISCAAMLGGRAHVIGPFVNVYNEGTLGYLVGRGAIRIVLPCEVPAAAMEGLVAAAGEAEIEVQVFGRLPLAISARCYHARFHKLHKDSCRYVCENDEDGLPLETLDGQPFLAVNGTQTLSHSVVNLVHAIDRLAAAGVRCFRLWPHAIDMTAVAAIFREACDGRITAREATERLLEHVDFAPFANGFCAGREGVAWETAPA